MTHTNFTKCLKLVQQGDKEFTVACNDVYCKVTLSVEGGVPEGTSIPVECLKDFQIVSEYNIGDL